MTDPTDIGESDPTDHTLPGRGAQKWLAGAVLPLLLLAYGTWVILPPHGMAFSRTHARSAAAIVVMLATITWGIVFISAGVTCFSYYFFGGETQWMWVERLFAVSIVTLFLSGFAMLILAAALEIVGYRRWFR